MRRKATVRIASLTFATLTLISILNSYTDNFHIAAHETTSSNNSNSAAFVSYPNLQPLHNNNKRSSSSSFSSEPPRSHSSSSLNAMRAWSCHGKSQKDLVDRLMQAGIVKHESVRDALYRVDRKNYAPNSDAPYIDAPQPIGLGQTISAPHMHAHVLEEIYPFLKASKDRQLRILDVGAGSGYLTAALGRWVAPLEAEGNQSQSSFLDDNKIGKVYGIEVHQHLIDFSRENVERDDKDLLDTGIVSLQKADGWKGLPDASPFDAIHVGAAAADFPRALLEQLKVGGVLIIPVGPQNGVQNLYRVERVGGGFTQNDFRIKELLGVRYVPLVQQSEEQN